MSDCERVEKVAPRTEPPKWGAREEKHKGRPAGLGRSVGANRSVRVLRAAFVSDAGRSFARPISEMFDYFLKYLLKITY